MVVDLLKLMTFGAGLELTVDVPPSILEGSEVRHNTRFSPPSSWI